VVSERPPILPNLIGFRSSAWKNWFSNYPGTLNLEISERDFPIIEALQKEEGIELMPPDPTFCAAKAMPLSVGHVSGAIIIPAEEVRVHGKQVIEVISPLKLKETLRVDDGDYLTLTVKKP
jgi:CTP-dependent riboflavin kinase